MNDNHTPVNGESSNTIGQLDIIPNNSTPVSPAAVSTPATTITTPMSPMSTASNDSSIMDVNETHIPLANRSDEMHIDTSHEAHHHHNNTNGNHHYVSSSSVNTPASTASPIAPPSPTSLTTVVIHIGSKEIRFGTGDDWIGPQTIENCIAIPVSGNSKSTSTKKKKQKPENIRSKELLRIRGQLLVDRKLIPADKVEQEVYFEEISLKETVPQPQPNQHLLKMQQMRRPQLSPSEEVIPGALFGKRAIEKVMSNDPTSKYELIYPFWKGNFNNNNNKSGSFTTDSLLKICEMTEAILAYILKALLKMSSERINESRLVLVLPDECIEQGRGIETHNLLDIALNKLKFSEVLIHKESVCAVFGAGASNACVVDLGESKTTLSVVEDGESVSRSELPYGGVNVTKTLLWILKQCTFPLAEEVSFDNLADQQNLERIRNEYCHLDEGNENFQQVDFLYNGQIYKMDIGDPLLLAPLSYFYPKMFGRECKLPEKEQDPYAEIEDEGVWTENNLKRIRDQTVEPPPAKKAKIEKKSSDKKTGKKKKKTTKGSTSKQSKEEEEPAADDPSKTTKGKLKTALALDRAIIRLIKSSQLDVETKGNKKKAINLNILLTGGLSHIKGMRQALEKRLLDHYSGKNEGKQIKINLLTNDRDKNMDVKFLSWNGGLILSHIEAAKKLWISQQDYQIHKDRVIEEKCAFVP